MLYFTGDIHADCISRFSFKTHPELRELTSDDFIIVLGDCGIPWYNPQLHFYDYWTKPGAEKAEHYQLTWLNNRPWKTIFLRGNHDNIDLIQEMPFTKLGHANVRQMCYEDILYENIFYIDTPQFMYLQGQKLLFIPGAESHDIDYIFEYDDPLTKDYIRQINKKYKRTGVETLYRVNHFSYWKNEGVNENLALKTVMHCPKEVDYVLTHAPRAAVHNQWKMPGAPARNNPSKSEIILENISKLITYKMWLHGHLHNYIELTNLYSIGLYYDILSLEDIEKKKKFFDLENKYYQEIMANK